MSDSQLKPCPFCGGKAVVARSDDEPLCFLQGVILFGAEGRP